MDMHLHLMPQPRLVLQYAARKPFVFAAPDGVAKNSLAWAEYLQGSEHALAGKLRRMGLADWRAKYGSLPDGFQPEEGYALAVGESGIDIAADTDAGFRHALQTLAQLLAQAGKGRLATLVVIDWPVMRRRCAHICYHLAADWMPESVPNFDALLRLIKLAAHFKLNSVLLEIEAMFPYRKHRVLAAHNAFTPEQIAVIGQTCAERGMEIIPLLQSLGHAYHVLCHAEYAHLREAPDTSQQYCPLNPEVLPFYIELAEEIRQAFPSVKRFHIGGDESRRLGVCPQCRAKAARDGVGALYGEHVGAVARAMLERGLTPLVWSDMIEHFPDAAGFIPAGTEFVYWKYALPRNGTPIDFEPFMRRGTTWAAVGIRSGISNHTMFRFPEAMQCIAFMAAEARRVACENFIATDWMKAIPFEFAEPGYAYAAEAAWGACRRQSAFFDDYAVLMCGAEHDLGADLMRVFDLLAFPLIPYCEDAQRHQFAGGLDRYDLSGLSFRERLARQMDVNEKSKIMDALSGGLQNAEAALDLIGNLRPHFGLDRRLLDLLELSAQTNAHKARLGLAVEEAARLLKFPCPDEAAPRARLAEKFENLSEEHDHLRTDTRRLLESVMFPDHLEANLDIKFEPAAQGWMAYFRDLLRCGKPVRCWLGREEIPVVAKAPQCYNKKT